jgi:hypothetical protein
MDMPGLAMTRSMGDKVGVQAGVIAEPGKKNKNKKERGKIQIEYYLFFERNS